MSDLWVGLSIGVAIGLVGGGVVVAVAGPVVAETLALRRTYFAPFRSWCARLNGSLGELLFWVDKLRSGASLEWPLTYHIVANFAEVHDLLAECDERGWSPALVSNDLGAAEFLSVREGVDDLYHSLRLPDGTLWSEIPDKRTRLLETAVSRIATASAEQLRSEPLRVGLGRLCERLGRETPSGTSQLIQGGDRILGNPEGEMDKTKLVVAEYNFVSALIPLYRRMELTAVAGAGLAGAAIIGAIGALEASATQGADRKAIYRAEAAMLAVAPWVVSPHHFVSPHSASAN